MVGTAVLVRVDGDPVRLRLEPGEAPVAPGLPVTIPRAHLESRLALVGGGAEVRIPAEHGIGRLLAATLATLASMPAPLAPREATGVMHHVAGLVTLALTEQLADEPSGRAARLRAAKDEIERNLTDPELTPELVARRVSISLSYLTKLFADDGTTVCRWIMARRLELAWQLLDPRLADPRSVTAIALACGFRDPTHFAKVFRARFGASPTARRSAA